MTMKSSLRSVLCTSIALVFGAAAMAQNVGNGSIAGVVRDTSGAALVGVTVEASSPALIEKSRTTTTDSGGAYQIINLRPGTYAVSFTVPGFKVFRREDLTLEAGFAATVNADMQVGDNTTSVTVTGVAQNVDVQNVSAAKVFGRDVTQNLPTGNTVKAYATLIAGTNYGGANQQDVGGGKSEFSQQFAIHGGQQNDFEQLRDGMFFGTMVAAGNWMTSLNPATVSEVSVQIGAAPAEMQNGGAMINVVTRDGGNNFHGTVNGSWTNADLQGGNLDAALIARGATQPTIYKQRYDIGAGVGGPIIKDKLWFFGSTREWETATTYSGIFYNSMPGTLYYVPDTSRPGFEDNTYREARMRLTYQATSKDKIAGMYGFEWNCNCPGTPANLVQAPETYIGSQYRPNYQSEVTWTHTQNNHLLFEAGVVLVAGRLNLVRFGATSHDIQSITDLNNNRIYGDVGYGIGLMGSLGHQSFGQYNETFAATYVSGSHTLKSGVTLLHGWRDVNFSYASGTQDQHFNVRGETPGNVTPVSVDFYALPFLDSERQNTFAWFVQDQWKIKRLTLNLGVRYDHLVGNVPAVTMPAGLNVGVRSFAAVSGTPTWNDWDPRLGVNFDVFGNGKTSIRAFAGRFVLFESVNGGIVQVASPANAMVTVATRAWNDANHNLVVDPGELGPINNTKFGTSAPSTIYDPSVLNGNRPYNWQQDVEVEQQLWRGTTIKVGYYRRSYGNFRAVVNQVVAPSDFTTYCATANIAAAPAAFQHLLPSAPICGLYDVNPNKFGQVNNLVTLASKVAGSGSPSDVFNGIDASFNTRFKKAFVQAGFATGAEATNYCYANALPNVTPLAINGNAVPAPTAAVTPRISGYCNVNPPWSGNTQFKAAVVYPLPWKLQASANYQNISPIPTYGTQSIPVANISGLGRPLSSGATVTPTTSVILPNTLYTEPRLNQLDIRLSRTFHLFRESTVQANVDVFNLFNANSVQQINTTIGGSWNNVLGFLDPRVVRFGGTWNF